MANLTLEDLAESTGEPAERLRRWRSLGLIGRESPDAFGPVDVQRARLIQLLLRRGMTLEAIARADREQGFLARYIAETFPDGVRATHSLADVTRMLGMNADAVRRFWQASGSVTREISSTTRTWRRRRRSGWPSRRAFPRKRWCSS